MCWLEADENVRGADKQVMSEFIHKTATSSLIILPHELADDEVGDMEQEGVCECQIFAQNSPATKSSSSTLHSASAHLVASHNTMAYCQQGNQQQHKILHLSYL